MCAVGAGGIDEPILQESYKFSIYISFILRKNISIILAT